MSDNDISERMRSDWNERAREDAYYYVAFGRKGQDDDEFFATAADVVRTLEGALKRLPAGDRRSRKALEIGCGPGRLMRPMSWNFGEIHGVDVSDEMVRLAAAKLTNVPNAFPRATDGTDLACYQDELFDFVYSYAVFQHIPSPEVIFSYLAEARRVLKTGGIARCQINGLPKTAKQYTTWEGARLGAAEIAEFACGHDFQLLALEGVDTQYMWVTLRKQPEGWFNRLAENPPRGPARIRNIVNAHSGEPVVPAGGRFACMSIWVEGLPADCDLNQINIEVEGEQAAPIYIGQPVFDGLCQVNALMPAKVRTGLVPVELLWFGEPLTEPAWVRVTPPGPAVARLTSLSDGVNLLSGSTITSRSVKLFLEELAAPEKLEVRVDGTKIASLDLFCTDPVNEKFEVNFQLPDSAAAGKHRVEMRLGARVFAPVAIDVVG
jgi:SAM-dependent methyltransferase